MKVKRLLKAIVREIAHCTACGKPGYHGMACGGSKPKGRRTR